LSVPITVRDVMKYKFELCNVRTLTILKRFKIRRKLWALWCRMWICGKILVLQLISCAQRARTNLFFSQIQPITQTIQLLNVRH